jgi:transcriptional regulator with XRE-family HTH domain
VNSSSFARALDEAIDKLEISRAEFARGAQISQSMVTKLLSGQEARRETYKKVFAFLETANAGLAQTVLRAFLRDLAEDVAPTVSTGDALVSGGRAAAILFAFEKRSTTILLALDVLASAAGRSTAAHNTLMALADLVSSKGEDHGDLGRKFFAPALKRPATGRRPGERPEFRLVGGSLGEFIAALNEEPEELPDEGGPGDQAR